MKNANGYYTVQEFAKLLRVHEHTVYNWINSGQIKAVKFGDLWRIPQSEFKKDNLREENNEE